MLAALLGALSLFHAAPAEAQGPSVPRNVSVTPGNDKLTINWQAPSSWGGTALGFLFEWKRSQDASSAWSPVLVNEVGHVSGPTDTSLDFVGRQLPKGSSTWHEVTHGTSYDLRIRAGSSDGTNNNLSSWVTVTNKMPTALRVSLSASPNPVAEGSGVTVTATRSGPGPATTIPVTVTRGTSEAGDHGTITGIGISAGITTGTATISTGVDADTDDETFTVALGGSLPNEHAAGSPSSVEVTITDNGVLGSEVTLSASPNPVTEGSGVTVTAALSKALSSNVTIPLTLTAGTAESGDYAPAASIPVAAGATSGTGTISTNWDTDEDDETFTVALGTLPSSVTAGTPSSVTITISDDRNPYNLGVESIPACGTMVTDMSVAASQVLVRTPPPVAKVRTEWRVLGDTDQRWLGAADIEPSGRSPRFVHNTFAELRRTFPRSAGFEYRLADVPRVTAECTWTFDDPENDGGPPIDTTTTTPDPGPPGPPGPPTGGGGGAPPPPTRSGDASLSALEISGISPDFDTDTDTYTVSAYDRDSVTVTPTANHDGAEITVNGNTVQSGSSAVVTLDEDGETSIEIVVTAEDGTVKTYTLTVMSCPGEERKILEMFYDSTQGDMWEESSEWNIEENDLRDWHGVETDEDDRVTALRLPHNTLSGEYPEALRCFVVLEELRELALWGNELSGDIPDEFALAVERAVLRDVAAALSLNPVWFDTYEDPYEFGDWHEGVTTDDDGRVTELDLTGEGIEGEIPESVFELKRLRAIETGCGVTLGVPAPGRVSVTMAEGCSDASLGNMEISPGELAFSPVDLFYETAVGYGPENITVTPETNHPRASLTINGEDAVSGEGMEITLNEEEPTVVSIEVTARDGTTTRTYKITVTRCGAEREDLVRFYEKTGGADWHENENWTSAEPLDRWFGVETDEDRSVISLRLEDNGLSGETPRELLCLSELKELALWDNDGLSGEVPQELALAVERAALRDVAVALSFKAEWFDRYEDHPYGFGDWHAGVTTDDDGRVTELDFTGEEITGEIPESVFELKRLRVIETGCGVTLETEAPGRVSVAMPDDCEGEPEGEPASSGDGGCALGSSGDSSAFALFLVTLLVFAALGRKRAR